MKLKKLVSKKTEAQPKATWELSDEECRAVSGGGGKGADLLIGGEGSDIFVIGSKAAHKSASLDSESSSTGAPIAGSPFVVQG